MAPTASGAAEEPVPEWRSGCKDSLEDAVSEVSCGKTMSDADTESSGGPWSQISITSSESDGPRIVVHNTSDDEEEEEEPETVRLCGLLQVARDSITTTDVGSDYTSEGGESVHLVSDPGALSPDLLHALVTQLEEYLSDDGLTKDLFLLKHVKRHRDGFVSLKLLSGYKKIKKLSRNWRVLGAAARTSASLQVNDEGTKVRRTAPLPSKLLHDVPASRALLAVNVPAHLATMSNLAVLFGTYGAVASLQVVRPKPGGGGVPPELQHLLPEVSHSTCAVVEYEDVWGAARALQDLDEPPLALHVLRRTSPRTSPSPKGQRTRNETGVSPDELRQRLKGRRYRLGQTQRESSASDGEDSPRRSSWWRSGPRQPSYRGGCSFSMPSSPAAFRRAQLQPQVTRCPRGPDGTRGFSQVTRCPRGPDGTRGFSQVRSQCPPSPLC